MPVIEINGHRQLVAHAYGTMRECAFDGCRRPFPVTSITGRQFYCQESCKEKALWRRERQRPDVLRYQRAKCRDWAAKNRNVTRANPWLLGAPPYHQYLPGGGFRIDIKPLRYPLELRNVRALHGLVTNMTGLGHGATVPQFSLAPVPGHNQWGVHIATTDAAEQLAASEYQGQLYSRDVVVKCGPMMRFKAPQIAQRGRRQLRIDAITPVSIRKDASAHTHLFPTGRNLTNTMGAWLPRRLGVELGDSDIRLELDERHTMPEYVPVGGKFGTFAGWTGHVIVTTNAVGHWLLKCAEVIGLGGRTAFGFGRIKVTQ